MNELYPLLMTPLFDPRPWGTYDLSPIYPQRFKEKIGESWLTGDHCKVQNGVLAGKSLAELAAQYRRELVGEAPADDSRFPLLAKFLFPHEKLSVQVHPDDDDARAIGQPWGKTECWYVAHAKPGAEIGLGLKPGTTRAEFENAIRESRAEELLNWIKVFPGDMIYVAGGTVHTLTGVGHRRNPAAVGYYIPPIRLRASAGAAFARGPARYKGKSRVGKSKAST